MLNVIFSDTSKGAAKAVFERLKRTPGRKIVLVPDSYTLGVEKTVMEETGLKATFDIEVTGFSRLASKETGAEVLSKEGGVLIMKRAINACAGELKHYAKVVGVQGFAGEMFAVVTSMRLNGVTPEMLQAAESDLDDCATLRKNRDIAIVYAKYLEELKKEGLDGTSRAERFAEEIPSNPRLRGVNVFALGFDSLSAIQIKILTELSLTGNVTAALLNGFGLPNAELYPDDSIRRLLNYARDRGVDVAKLVWARERLAEPFKTLHENMFSGTETTVRNNGEVVLFGEADIFEQFNAVAREIVRLVRREGLRYKDIAIINAEPEHNKELDEVFARYSIPRYIDLRYPLKDTLPAKYIVAITDAVRFNFRRDKVFRLLKSPLFEWDEDQKFRFENYILKANKDFDAFLQPLDGEGEEFEELRKALVAVAEPFRTKKVAARYAEAVAEMLTDEKFSRLLSAAVEGIEDNLVEANTRAGGKIAELMAEYVRLCGEHEEGIEQFRSAFDAMVAAEELALIPRSLDSVFVGELRSGYIYGTRALFIIGATQGALPAKHNFRSVISAADAVRLEDVGIKLYPTPYDSMREEQFAVTELFSKTDRIYFGYPMSSDSGILKPSSVITELSERTSTPIIKLSDRFSAEKLTDAESVEDFISSPQNAVFGYLMYREKLSKGVRTAIEKALDSVGLQPKVSSDSSPERVPMRESLGQGKDPISSVSQIECYYACPYRYYLRYGIALKEREEGKLRPPDIGILSHRAMELYFGRFKNRVHTADPEELRAARESIARSVPEEAGKNVGNISKATLNSLEKSLIHSMKKLTDSVLSGDFEPVAVEMKFGFDDGKPLRLTGEDSDVYLRGKIDRVDADGASVAVLDYKTGSESWDISGIYYGKKLQSAIYLKVAAERTGLRPVGAFYVPLRSSYTKAGKSYKYDGIISDDIDVLTAFDSKLAAVTSGRMTSDIVPGGVKITAGEVLPIETKNTLSREEMSETLDYAAKMAAEAVKEIASGVNSREPLKGECARCGYREICAGRIDREREFTTTALPYAPSESKEEE